MTADIESCLPFLEGFELPLTSKVEFIRSLHELFEGVMDVIERADSTSLSMKQAAQISSSNTRCVVKLSSIFSEKI